METSKFMGQKIIIVVGSVRFIMKHKMLLDLGNIHTSMEIFIYSFVSFIPPYSYIGNHEDKKMLKRFRK